MNRGKVQVGATYGSKLTVANHAYQEYKYRNRPESKLYVTRSKFSEIVKVFSESLVEELLTGAEVVLPSRLGSLQVSKYKLAKPRINFGDSLKYSTTLPHANQHSDGYVVRLHWSKSMANFPFKQFWGFLLTKGAKSRNAISISKHVQKYGVNNFVEIRKYGSF